MTFVTDNRSLCGRDGPGVIARSADWFRCFVFGVCAMVASGFAASASTAELTEVTGFGSNPGNLRMLQYVPDGIGGAAPLVVVLHGCRQTAEAYGPTSGWMELADSHGFLLLLPAQQTANNDRNCFNWFLPGDNRRDLGEALSIRQMVDAVKATHTIDETRVFVSGLSAGGAMTAVMLATYPEVFAGGGVVAGLPFGCANNLLEALQCMDNAQPSGLPAITLPSGTLAGLQSDLPVDLPMSPAFCFFFPLLCQEEPGGGFGPKEWGDFVRAASPHDGPFPRVSVWHGTADSTVDLLNATALVEQWTNVHGLSAEPTSHDVVNGFAHQLYEDEAGVARVELYTITGMAHGKPIDPGTEAGNCGVPDEFVLDVNICSSGFIAEFWGLQPVD